MSKLGILNAWNEGASNFLSKNSAQSYMGAMATIGTCGSACGAGDEQPAPKPTACGSACGAGDK